MALAIYFLIYTIKIRLGYMIIIINLLKSILIIYKINIIIYLLLF
jgi:hypothetical protein